MSERRKQELLTEGGEFLAAAAALRSMSDDALELNETAARNLLINMAEGQPVPQKLCGKAQEMLLLIDFVRNMKSMHHDNPKQH